PTGLDVSFTYDGQPSAPTLPGTYPVIASINDANYQGTASGTLAVRITALVRHAPAFNGDVDGSIQVLLPESVTLNSSSSVSHDLLVPGRPGLRLNGSPTFVGTLDQTGAATPTNHLITLNSGAVLRYAVRRVDALALPVVPAPDAPTGTRSVSVNNATTPIGSFATLRNLTLNSGAGFVAVPPGAYGNFTANSGGFILGTAGADTPSVYHLQRLTLNGSARLQVAGPVIVRLASGLTLQASAGASDHADWLVLEFAGGGLTLNNGGVLHGHVVAPGGTVTINGNATLHGTVTSDRLTLNSNGLLSEPTD
ncbi:MAG TPA: MBG domain-containing protein, partial [Lacunisphaera sp.]|nr:MBG domain-containing protein [Lacunisphaera sp.]